MLLPTTAGRIPPTNINKGEKFMQYLSNSFSLDMVANQFGELSLLRIMPISLKEIPPGCTLLANNENLGDITKRNGKAQKVRPLLHPNDVLYIINPKYSDNGKTYALKIDFAKGCGECNACSSCCGMVDFLHGID